MIEYSNSKPCNLKKGVNLGKIVGFGGVQLNA